MSTALIISIVGLISAIGSSFLTFLFARRKNKAEALSLELENAQKVISIWRELSKELEIRIDDLQNDLQTLEANYKEQCDMCEYKQAFFKNKIE